MTARTRVYVLELSLPFEQALTELDARWLSKESGRAALLVRIGYGRAPRLLEYSYALAYKTLAHSSAGASKAKNLSLEWLRWLAGTRRFDRAIALTKPTAPLVCLAANQDLPPDVISALGTPQSPGVISDADVSSLAGAYGFTRAAFGQYGFEALARERTALARLE